MGASRKPTKAVAEARGELCAALDGTDPTGFESLTAAQLRHLAGAISGARRQHAEELRAATATALGNVPKLLRGPVRRIVGI